MTQARPSFFARLGIALAAYFRTLFDADFASSVQSLRLGKLPAPAQEPEAVEPVQEEPPPAFLETGPASALQLLGLLQREGRLIDFLEEEIADFSDADIGAAARVVHEGCRKALKEHFQVQAVRTEDEGTRITLEEGFDASAIRLTGNVSGAAPFHGTLQHRGWRVVEVSLPQVSVDHDLHVVTPAEVEL